VQGEWSLETINHFACDFARCSSFGEVTDKTVDLILKLMHETRSTIITVFAVGIGEGDGDFADLAVGPEVDGPPRERLGRAGARERGRVAVNR